jgi:hypothetical protein
LYEVLSMKFRELAALSLLLVGAAPCSAATVNADLRVAGSIVPAGSCNVTIGDGVIEFGTVELEPDPAKPTRLDEQRVKMAIGCTAPTRYALVATSSSSVGIADPHNFGLVSVSDRSATGSLYVRIDSASDHIEGKRAYHTGADAFVDLASATWGPSTFSTWPIARGSLAIGFVTADGSYEVPPRIKDFDTYLLVSPTIKPSSELNRTDEIAFSGDLGFEIRYF